MKFRQTPTRRRSIWMSVGSVTIIGFAGITAAYIEARQKTEVSNQLSAQAEQTSKELDLLKQQQLAIKEKEAADKSKQSKATSSSATAASDENDTIVASPLSSTGTNGHSNPYDIDVIVNKKHPLRPLSFAPRLQSVSCAGYGTALLSTSVSSDFAQLCAAAKAAGVPVGVSSSYRSYGEQVSTYNYWVSISGKSGADTYSARPGHSEHQTGLAVDFMVPNGARLSDFTGTRQQKWLASNAWKYGFIQRYTTANTSTTGYSAESWHYRYIGKSAAKDYINRSISSLEHYWGVSGGKY